MQWLGDLEAEQRQFKKQRQSNKISQIEALLDCETIEI
jgi:hypothetical protein